MTTVSRMFDIKNLTEYPISDIHATQEVLMDMVKDFTEVFTHQDTTLFVSESKYIWVISVDETKFYIPLFYRDHTSVTEKNIQDVIGLQTYKHIIECFGNATTIGNDSGTSVISEIITFMQFMFTLEKLHGDYTNDSKPIFLLLNSLLEYYSQNNSSLHLFAWSLGVLFMSRYSDSVKDDNMMSTEVYLHHIYSVGDIIA